MKTEPISAEMASASQKSPPAAPAPPAKPLALRWRVLITLAILLHLTAVIAAPLAVWPSSELQQNLAETFRPYICAAYLDHGYRFFAPMPSPGHLVRYTLQMPDGTSQTGTFPDLKTEWPRLFYHRHFMLSEKLAQFYDPDQPGANDPPAARAQWQAERKTFAAIAKSYADYLLRTFARSKSPSSTSSTISPATKNCSKIIRSTIRKNSASSGPARSRTIPYEAPGRLLP